jgi:hypothetical protein
LLLDKQAAAGGSILQLKLLSLQGSSKSVCRIHSLSLVIAGGVQRQQQPDASRQPDTAQLPGVSADASTAPPSQQQQQPLSQLDELRMLVQQLQQPGTAAGGGTAVPQSLQLLHDKAMRTPEAGPAAAMKTLSALLAQGMMHQAAQQRAGQQQEQQPAPDGGSLDRTTMLKGMERLEAKVDAVLAAVQQLDRRLGALEERVTERACCGLQRSSYRDGQTALQTMCPGAPTNSGRTNFASKGSRHN